MAEGISKFYVPQDRTSVAHFFSKAGNLIQSEASWVGARLWQTLGDRPLTRRIRDSMQEAVWNYQEHRQVVTERREARQRFEQEFQAMGKVRLLLYANPPLDWLATHLQTDEFSVLSPGAKHTILAKLATEKLSSQLTTLEERYLAHSILDRAAAMNERRAF